VTDLPDTEGTTEPTALPETDAATIVTFGETMLRLAPLNHERLQTASRLDVQAAGAESNAAIAASQFGADAVWLSKLPEGPLGDRVIRELRGHGIDPAVARGGDRQGLYFVEHGGTPRGVNVVYDRSDAAITTATAEELPTEAVREAQVFFTTGITPALSDQLRSTTETLLSEASAAGMTTAFDLNHRGKLWEPAAAQAAIEPLFENFDVLIVAERDAETVLDVSGRPSQVVHSIASKYDFRTVVLTRGEKGAVAWHDTVVHEQAAFEAETRDPVGTGDAFAGTFLARRLAGSGVEEALEYAAAAAALKRTIPGDVLTATIDEVERVIESGTESVSR
jgi:2-dehydro-3-deoxygluconokinase